jgi:hypothetical protein
MDIEYLIVDGNFFTIYMVKVQNRRSLSSSNEISMNWSDLDV